MTANAVTNSNSQGQGSDALGVAGTSSSLEDEIRWYFSPGDPKRGPINHNPYPFYDRMRNADRVYEVNGIWFATGYKESNELVRNGSWRRVLDRPVDRVRDAERVFLDTFTFVDEPDHTRLKRMVSPAFTPGEIARRRERVREIVRELLDGLRARDEFDFIDDFAALVPASVMAEMLGVRGGGHTQDLIRWSKAREQVALLGRVFGDAAEYGPPPQTEEELAALDRTAMECESFFRAQVERRAEDPGDDVISVMLTASTEEEGRATHQEVVSMCRGLHLGGQATTSNMLANGLTLLAKHPQSLEDIKNDPALIPGAVEEMLRYETPAKNTVHRIAPTDDMVLGGHGIPEGSLVYAILAAANRDPDVYTDPHQFDIRRENNRHLSFGAGPRFCLGAVLARLEIQEAFSVLIGEYPALTVDVDSLRWRDSFVFRALESLPVRWSDR